MTCAECSYWEECMGGCRFQKKEKAEYETYLRLKEKYADDSQNAKKEEGMMMR